jgi:hypothetical protein
LKDRCSPAFVARAEQALVDETVMSVAVQF